MVFIAAVVTVVIYGALMSWHPPYEILALITAMGVTISAAAMFAAGRSTQRVSDTRKFFRERTR